MLSFVYHALTKPFFYLVFAYNDKKLLTLQSFFVTTSVCMNYKKGFIASHQRSTTTKELWYPCLLLPIFSVLALYCHKNIFWIWIFWEVENVFCLSLFGSLGPSASLSDKTASSSWSSSTCKHLETWTYTVFFTNKDLLFSDSESCQHSLLVCA